MQTVVPAVLRKWAASSEASDTLLSYIGALPGIVIEEKKTCVHITAGKAAFLGIHPRKSGLSLSIVLNRPLTGSRIRKCEQLSAKRFHSELNLDGGQVIDDELAAWIEEAYRLKSA